MAVAPERTVTHRRAVAIDLLAGTVAGITSTYAGYPLDLIKFRLQVSPQDTISHCVRQIRAEGGSLGFFKGVLSPALGNIPINALVFASNGLCKKYLDPFDMHENAKLYLSGCFAGLASLIAFVPTELIKIRIQDDHTSSRNRIGAQSVYRQVTREIYLADGARGFYKGFWPHFWRDVPTYGIYFLSYDFFQRYTVKEKRDNGFRVYLGKMLAGGLAGMLTWLFAYPMDVVKSTVQSGSFKNNRASMASVMKHLY